MSEQPSENIKYSRAVLGMVGLQKSYHTVAIDEYGEVKVTIVVKSPVVERVVNYYEMAHQEEIQNDIREKKRLRTLPKLSSVKKKLMVPPKRPSTSSDSRQRQFTRVDQNLICSSCKKYAYKGYRLESGDYICRDCRNAMRNPSPKPKLIYQNFEGGKRR